MPDDSDLPESDSVQSNDDDSLSTHDEDSTVGVGSAFAVGCSLIVLLVTLGGVCYLIAQRAT